MDYCTVSCGVDSSYRFPFTARTDRRLTHKSADATDRRGQQEKPVTPRIPRSSRCDNNFSNACITSEVTRLDSQSGQSRLLPCMFYAIIYAIDHGGDVSTEAVHGLAIIRPPDGRESAIPTDCSRMSLLTVFKHKQWLQGADVRDSAATSVLVQPQCLAPPREIIK